MWSIHPYVYVNSAGLPVGFENPVDTVNAFIKQNMPFGRDSEAESMVGQFVADGILRHDHHIPDCSPRHAVIFRNDKKQPLEHFVNAHLWELPLSMKYLREAFTNWEARPGPRVGDYCINGSKISRFTHAWHDDGEIQDGGGNGSYHMGRQGYASYSGGLDPCIKIEHLADTCTRRWGEFWFFKDGWTGAHRGIHFLMPVRVYTVVMKAEDN